MNYKMIVNTVGRIVSVEAVLLLLPALTAVYYGEECVWSILWTMAIALPVGLGAALFVRPRNTVIYAKEGFLIVSLAWLLLSAIGALPFVFSGEIPSFVDAFFETVSGFSTTGASILTDVEGISRGLLFWRSFTHWIGGMGVLVFVVAIMPDMSGRPIHLLRAEMPGPTMGKLVPRIKDTAKILYLIYIVMTVIEIVLLVLGGMPVFDSVIHTFGTAGTGGFGIKADSIASYAPYLQWVITIFMLLFGVNFNLYYLLLIRRFRSVFRSTELWAYLGVVAVAAVLIGINIYPLYENVEQTIRLSAFQVSSIITTTGYATADFNMWPGFSKAVLILLMFVGGCAGSTAGGLKVSRVVILFKSFIKEWKHMLHPRSVNAVRMEGKTLDNNMLSGVGAYFAVYMLCLMAAFLILSVEPFGLETNLSAAIACFNNVGPGLGGVGPTANYAAYSDLSKIVLSFAMLLGRLEIFPLLLSLSPATWRKRG